MSEQLYVYAENPASLTNQPFRAESLRILEIMTERTRMFAQVPFIVREAMRTYCNLYIEYYYKAKAINIPMPGRRDFCVYVWTLARNRECTIKFVIRMLLFLVSPGLYRRLLIR